MTGTTFRVEGPAGAGWRALFRGTLAAAGLFAVVLTLLAGKALAGPPAEAANTLRLARISDPVTLDAALPEMAEDFMLLSLLYLPLLDVTNGTQLTPCAAAHWDASPDMRTYTLRLRPGIKFSNGRPVVADDYRFAMERIINPSTASPYAVYLDGVRGAAAFKAGKTNHVAGLWTRGPDTLGVELERPDPTFPYVLTSNMGMAVPAEEFPRLAPTYGVRPVGTGPYIVQEWVRGVRLRFVRNPYYAGPEPQHLAAIEIMIGGDETTHLMMFERGELDIASINGTGVPFPSFRRLRHDPKWRGLLEHQSIFNMTYLVLNTEVAPLDNVLVRRAICHAIDRDRLEHVALGLCAHAQGAIPPIMPGYNPSLHGYDFNPDKARELLRQTGLALPLHTVLWHSTQENDLSGAQMIQADLGKVGIDLELKPATFAELVAAAQLRHKVPMHLNGWNVTLPDPKDFLETLFDGRTITNNPTQNLSFYNNPEVNRLLDQALPEIDLQRRFALFQQAEQLIVRDAPCVFLGHLNLYALRQPRLKGPLLEPLWWYRFDRVWIER